MGLFEEPIDFCSYEIRKGGAFSKKEHVFISVYASKITGEAFDYIEGQLSHVPFDVPYEQIINVGVDNIDGKSSVIIQYKLETLLLSGTKTKSIVLWGITDPDRWSSLISESLQTHMHKQQQMLLEKELELRKQQELQLQYEKAASDFFTSCYSFHIHDETPVYTFSSEKNGVVALYVDQDKSLNFLSINGYAKTENVGTIPYEKIHYFEKAGNVSYATDIHGSYSSFGGSFTGSSFSKLSTAVGGALFGVMGMLAGAMLTYKPAEHVESTTSFSLDSDIVKIDDRNVILNFYSDSKRQYVDIELPHDIYNFLQTHLPEKKYGIVDALEKKTAVQQSLGAIESGALLSAGRATPSNALPSSQENSMDVFKQKVEKLKIMKDAGLLSPEEFDEERKKLLELL